MIFVDTGIWYARTVPTDPQHQAIRRWFMQNREPLLTTNDILNETLTLLRARGETTRALTLAPLVLGEVLAQIYSTTEQDILAAWDIYQRYRAKEWSFTDCTSYVIIARLHIQTALSLDHHFSQFGHVSVVP